MSRPFLYVPNLIGYARIMLMLASFGLMQHFPVAFLLCYGLSCNLDAIDGYMARKLNQSTKFGAVLDMVTDRCTTIGLLIFLATKFACCAALFQVLVALDVSSHFMVMYW